jgi:hypothetical protein
MKSAILNGAQVALTAGAVFLIAMLIIPWKEPTAWEAPPAASSAPEAIPAIPQEKPERVAPQEILALFIKSAPPAPQTVMHREPSPEVKTPVDAPWLAYLGFYKGAPGNPNSLLLKDTRSGRVMQVSPTGAPGGWSLVEASDKRLVVRHADDVYVVNKRQP